MAAQAEVRLRGTLHFTPEGSHAPIDLGEVEIPIRLDIGAKPGKPGPVYRGTGIRGFGDERTDPSPPVGS